MASSTSPAAQNGQPSQGLWPLVEPYAAPPLAAAGGIIPAYRHLIAKSYQQCELPVPRMTLLEGLKKGLFKGAPTVGVVIGTQMILQNAVERVLAGNTTSLSSTLMSAALVGMASAPVLAVFNGGTMGYTVLQSLRRFSGKQVLALTVQETGCLGGLSAAGPLADFMRRKVGDNKIVECATAFTSGALGALAGHPANTAVTRWQKGLTLDTFHQPMLGAARRTYGVGMLSVLYQLNRDALKPTVEQPK